MTAARIPWSRSRSPIGAANPRSDSSSKRFFNETKKMNKEARTCWDVPEEALRRANATTTTSLERVQRADDTQNASAGVLLYRAKRRSLSDDASTDTLDSDIAALAITGERSQPVIG